ncbi:MAG: hypothetical protein ACK4Z5_03295 [Brevundimonas sp.]
MTALQDFPRSPDTPQGDDAGIRRSVHLLMRLEAGRALPVLTPIADMAPACDGSGEVFVYCTVYVDAVDGKGRERFALHEVRLAADALDADPSIPAARFVAGRLRVAAAHAARAALLLQRSLT